MKNGIKKNLAKLLVLGLVLSMMQVGAISSDASSGKSDASSDVVMIKGAESDGEIRIAATATPRATATVRPTPTVRPTANPYSSTYYVSRNAASDSTTFSKYNNNSNENWLSGGMYLNYHTAMSLTALSTSELIVELQVVDNEGNSYELGAGSNNVKITKQYQAIPLNLIGAKGDRKYTVSVYETVDGTSIDDTGKSCDFVLYNELQANLSTSGEIQGKSGDTVTLTVNATGGSGSSYYKYQWYRVNGEIATPITGETGKTYQPRVQGKTIYQVVVSDSIGSLSPLRVSVVAVYSISYDLAYDGKTLESQTKKYGEPCVIKSLPENENREGWTFLGWKDAASGGRMYNAGDSYSQESDLQLVAQWQRKESIKVSISKKEIVFGKTAKIRIENLGGRPVQLKSSDNNILKPVGDDTVKAVGFGKATITVSVSGGDGYKEEERKIKDILVLPPAISGLKFSGKEGSNYIYTWKDVLKSIRKNKKNNAKKYNLKYHYEILKVDKGKDSAINSPDNRAKVPEMWKGKTIVFYIWYKYKGDPILGTMIKRKVGK